MTLVLRGVTREFGTRGAQAEPSGRRDRAVLLMTRDLLARASELVALEVADVTPVQMDWASSP